MGSQEKQNVLIHYMMNSGRHGAVPCPVQTENLARYLVEMYAPGRHLSPLVGYEVEVLAMQAGCFGVMIEERTRHPAMAIAVADTHAAAECLWPELVGFHKSLKSQAALKAPRPCLATRPTIIPWYATLIMFAKEREKERLEEFGQHFAWGWVGFKQRQRAAVG